MAFKPALWYPLSIALSAINLAAAGFAARSAEPWHATTHAALAVAFGLWAQRLRQSQGGRVLEGGGVLEDRIEALEADMSQLRQELIETQERLEFAERLLAQAPEARRVDPQR